MNPMRYLILGILLFSLPTFTKAQTPAPANFQSSFTADGLLLSWDASTLSNIKGYNVYVKRPGTNDFVLITSQPITETSVKLKHLRTGAEYQFAVSTVDPSGVESPMNRLTVTEKASALSTPQGFKAEATDTGIQLTWDKADPALVSGFNLYLADDTGKPSRKLSAAPLTDNQVFLGKVKRDKIYRFILTALSKDGLEGPPTKAVEAVCPSQLAENQAVSVAETPNASEGSKSEEENPPSPFYLVAGGGIDLPVKNWQPAYNRGPGGRIGVGYEINKSLSVQLDAENFYFSGTNYSGSISDIAVLVLPSVRYSFNGPGFRPYLSVGVGGDLEILSSAPGSTTIQNLDAVIGAGVEVPVADRIYVLIEGRYNLIFFSNVTGQDVPILAGVRFGL